MNNEVQSLENIIITLYKEFKNREDVKKAVRLFIRKDVIKIATELYESEKFVDIIINRYIIKETK